MDLTALNLKQIFVLVLIVLGVAIVLRHVFKSLTLGVFHYDNSGDTYRCRMEFNDLDVIEKHKYLIVKVRESDLSLPGERKAQK